MTISRSRWRQGEWPRCSSKLCLTTPGVAPDPPIGSAVASSFVLVLVLVLGGGRPGAKAIEYEYEYEHDPQRAVFAGGFGVMRHSLALPPPRIFFWTK